MISDERFFAWLDGELDAADAAEVEAMVARDPSLQRKADAHRALASRLGSAFATVANAPLPDRLVDTARPSDAQIIDLATRRPTRRPTAPVQWAAMAATLVLGIGAGSLIEFGSPAPVAREAGHLVASGELEKALYARLASQPVDNGVRIGLTFRKAGGELCRSFTDEGISGLACHESGNWRLKGLFETGEGQGTEYRMASGLDPRLAALIESTMAGESMDAEAERRALREFD